MSENSDKTFYENNFGGPKILKNARQNQRNEKMQESFDPHEDGGIEHRFHRKDAIKYGVCEAIFLQTIRYWTHQNMDNPDHHRDGRIWCMMTIKTMQRLWPYFSIDQIKHIKKKLVQKGAIRCEQFNGYDRRTYITLSEEIMPKVDPPPIGEISPMEGGNIPNGRGKSPPSTLSNSNSNNNINTRKSAPSVNDEVNQLIDHWNAKGNLPPQLPGARDKTFIIPRLMIGLRKEYPDDTIARAIDRYSELNKAENWRTHTYTLEQFLKQAVKDPLESKVNEFFTVSYKTPQAPDNGGKQDLKLEDPCENGKRYKTWEEEMDDYVSELEKKMELEKNGD